jgi:uncharacterized protein YbjQ (UPF0145 family)
MARTRAAGHALDALPQIEREGQRIAPPLAQIAAGADWRAGLRRAGSADYRSGMLISTMNDLPGYEVTEVLGEVFGLTVRSRNAFSQMGSSLKSMFGGELKGMTQALTDSRNQVIERMVEEAQTKGADAILAMRFDTSEMGPNWTEICAYGTAVKVRKI